MAVNWRKIFTSPYSDKTHFIYELIQNADDSKSTRLEFHLCENELIVWNDGRQFTEKDKESICSIGFSNKDLTQIGTFGMGITAVFTYTDCLEVYSGDKYFCIQIKDPTKPENIDFDAIDSTIIEQLGKGRTVFRLPFRERLREKDITKLRDRLCNLGEKRPLLFLRHLERVAWRDELGAQVGSYFCQRCRRDKMQNASEVELTTSVDDNNQRSETFLIFRKEVQPPQNVVAELLLQAAEDEDEHQRIQGSVEKLQPVEVAFRLQNDKITTMTERCMLFSYLSTQKETHLRFIIQARYQTTLARDNIEEMENNLWNEWLVTETANSLPEVLEQLKAGGLLKPAFFDVLPLKREVEKAFKPIAKALRQAMRERAFIPTEKEGHYAKIEDVLYPHDELLREFIESSWLHPNSSWLHPDIQDKEEFRRRFTFMQDAGVNIIGFRRMLRWLEEKDSDWFEDKSNEWLCSLYAYLNKHQSELERIKKLPLVRLENEHHVCANDDLVFFPPNADEAREEIKPFLNNLPILQSTLLAGEKGNEIEAFLKNVGVKPPRRVDMILKGICPQYRKFAKPSAEENCLHMRYLFKVWNDVPESEQSKLKAQISEIPILRAYKSQNSVAEFRYVKPCDAYLPQVYTSDDDLETYFSVCDGDIWFVDNAYVEDKSDAKTWLQFLKAIGAMDTPQVVKKSIPAYYRDYQEFDKRSIKREWSNHEQTIEDFYLRGLSEALDEISGCGKVNLSQALWGILVKTVPSGKWSRDTFFKGTHRWFHHSPRSKSFEATFYRQLKETAWLPDVQGNLHPPAKCFATTSENLRLLGNSVAYLHPDFSIRTELARWLAEKLDMRLKPDRESVLNYLQKLSSSTEVGVKKIESLYCFLRSEIEDTQLREKFKKEPLFFAPNPEPRWWRIDEVFWEDASEVFKNDRGYLKTHYPETLKPFFIALGVSEQPSQQDYARGIQEIATAKQAEDKVVRERIKNLYGSLSPWFQADQWETIYNRRCWLGKIGNKWGFYTRQELVLKDHPYIAEIFEAKIPFWAFNDGLSSLTLKLKVENCSQAQAEFHPEGSQEEDIDWSVKVQKLRSHIHDFLNSPRLCEEYEEEKSAEVLDQLSVCRVQELKVTYKLKGISLPDPNPRQSFLDVTDQKVALWLGLEESEDEYPELIGDALQEHFGAKELGRFVEDLLTPTKKQDRVLSNWKRKGLETKFLDGDPKDDEKRQIGSFDERFPDEPNSGDADSADDESDMRIPTGNETPKTDSEGEDNESLTDKADESEIHLSSNGDDDLRTNGSEIETSIDSEMTEIDESDNDSTSDESEALQTWHQML